MVIPLKRLIKKISSKKELLQEAINSGAQFSTTDGSIVRHDIYRDAAILCIHGQAYECKEHWQCWKQAGEQSPEVEEKEVSYIQANLVKNFNDGTGKTNCIYIIDYQKSKNPQDIDALSVLKSNYPNYSLYKERTGYFDFDTMLVKYEDF